MLREDPPDLADNGGMVLTEMAGRHERLGHRPVQMRTCTRPSHRYLRPWAGRAGPR